MTRRIPLAQTSFMVKGSQARDFLHRMLSQDVKGMATGDVRRAFLLTREGRPVALFLVWALNDRFLLTCADDAAPAARAHLERYVIADDVDIGSPFGFSVLSVGRATLPKADPIEPGRFVESPGLFLGRQDVGTTPAYLSVSAGNGGNRLQNAFVLFGLTVPDLRRLDGELDALRVEEGVPAWGAEIDGRVLPTETGPMDAISTTKGCYPGQEPVVMSLHRGHPPTRLCRIAIDGDDVPARDAPLTLDGRPAGRVTTAVAAPAGVRALALVRHDVAKEGALLLVGSADASVTRVLV